MERPPVLVHQDNGFINFRHYAFSEPGQHAYRWVDIKRFALTAEAGSDADVLAQLIGHAHFADSYDGGGVHPEGGRHAATV